MTLFSLPVAYQCVKLLAVFSINRGLADAAAYIFSPPRRAVCFCAVMRGVEFHVVKN